MLCISRNYGERLIIGKAGDVLTEPIVIEVIRPWMPTHKMLRLGIQAQRDVLILRAELLDPQPESDPCQVD
jgi:sRNA-binding carbon storage regulator CsrA